MSSSAWWIVGGWTARRDRGLRKPGAAKPHSLAPARRQNNPAPLSANRFVLTLAFARSTPTIAAAAEGVARRVCRAEFDWAREDVVDGDRMSSRLGVFNSGCSTGGVASGCFNQHHSNTFFDRPPIQLSTSMSLSEALSNFEQRYRQGSRSESVITEQGGKSSPTHGVKVRRVEMRRVYTSRPAVSGTPDFVRE